MAQKILGIDLGTNSLGIALRNPELGKNITDQLEYYTSIIFKSGVGKSKSGEYSYAAERTSHRSSRRLYQARRYRLWSTLALLIENDYCPLTLEQLDKWRIYDKAKGLTRQYPIDAVDFESWIRLDFDGDGKPDYTSPYQLRAELTERQFDFQDQTERYKLGRALYHIAQHRGFKSSKGETLKEQEANEKNLDKLEVDLTDELKKSEEKKAKSIKDYMDLHQLPTIGCAYASLEHEGVRIRHSEYTAIRSQYKEEINYIFQYQQGLETHSDFHNRLVSERKHEGTIFYRRPLRSQKGNVGYCVMESKKRRCPISHPDFEEFRAWSFINNIKYRTSPEEAWQTLSLEIKESLFQDKFLMAKPYAKFQEIRLWLEKKLGLKLEYSREQRTINYPDRTSVSLCPVLYRITKILGPDWRTATINTTSQRTNHKTGELHTIRYNYEDLWHIAFSYEDFEAINQFAQKAQLSDEQTQELKRMSNACQQGYAMLSLKAIRNILPFLHQGLIYSNAVLLAKIPDIIGQDQWQTHGTMLMASLDNIITDNQQHKRWLNIVNNLIAGYKSRALDQQTAYRNVDYLLDDQDRKDIDDCISESYRPKEWKTMSADAQNEVRQFVTEHYQQFFSTSDRKYYTLPKVGDAIKNYLSQKIGCADGTYKWQLLYHPSQIEFYAPVPEKRYAVDGAMMSLRLLNTPSLGSIKNPVALRAMHVLRHQINEMLLRGMIDEDTRIVVETARELNDANMRWAINTYQRSREDANKKIKSIIEEMRGCTCSDDDVAKARLLVEQNGEDPVIEKSFEKTIKAEIAKYKLWLEQGCRCLYTGKVISLSSLFDDNKFEVEHTIPRSISFDNSLSNLTVCESHFNRYEKINRIPSELNNYAEIMQRIEPWMKKVEHLKDQVELWRTRAKHAADKDTKDSRIRQMHLWQMELDYWQAKVRTFTITRDQLDLGFRHSQLVDTRITTKYAYHFLRSAFNNVEVQRGETTAAFRKILGIQSQDEAKDRSRHSHHAIDAAMLTIVPPAAKRDKMMELFYQITESKKASVSHSEIVDADILKKKLEEMKSSCNIGKVDHLAETIDENLLANLVTIDRTLQPASRRLRRNGKVVPGIVQKGDSIRANLHNDTFYGAIMYPSTDEHSTPIMKDGQWVYPTDKDGKAKVNLVVRVPIANFQTEKDLSVIVDPHVRDSVRQHLLWVADGTLEKDAPVYMLDSEGKEKRMDRNGRQLSPIRHIRCYAKAGKGYLGYDKALHIKQQTYLSDKDYKRSFHVQNADNYLCLLYQGVKKGTVDRVVRFINPFEIAKLSIQKVEQLASEPYYASLTKGKVTYTLTAIIKSGTRMLFWDKHPEEIRDLDKGQLLKRLFVTDNFNNSGTDYIYLKHHDYAGDDSAQSKGVTNFVSSDSPQLLKLTPNNLNALIENVDFEIDILGNITFYD